MILTLALAAAFAVGAPAYADTATGAAGPTLQVEVDSAHSRIIVTAGPFDLPSMAGMDMSDMEHHPPEVMRFQWPVDGYMRGFDVEMRDADGHPLPRQILHHLIGVNFDRRQIVYHAVERLFGWGAETDPVELPSSLGVPLLRGEHLGVYAMFHNETPNDIKAAYLRVTLEYTPDDKHPLPVMPFYVDVDNHIGGVTTFDVPPGRSERSYTFELPLSGRLVGIGGHLHDYGSSLTLKDAATGKVLAKLSAKRDHDGHVEGVGRFIFGFNSDALALEAHHPYTVTAVYDNPTHDMIKDGAMGHINGAFAPDDMSRWPKLDLGDPLVQKDIAALPTMTDMNDGTARAHHHSGAAGGGEAKMDMPMGCSAMSGMKMSGMKSDCASHDHGTMSDSTRSPRR